MKIIKLFSVKENLIELLKQQNRKAQQQFFDRHAPSMMMVCRRYMKNDYEAEDTMLKGFLKVFNQINHLEDPTKVEAWLKKIMVNTCLDELRKQRLRFDDITDDVFDDNDDDANAETIDVELQDILACLDELPKGSKTVFNLYYVDHKKHKEIAQILQISENTSKTQLAYAKKGLRILLEKKFNHMHQSS